MIWFEGVKLSYSPCIKKWEAILNKYGNRSCENGCTYVEYGSDIFEVVDKLFIAYKTKGTKWFPKGKL